MRRSLVGCDPVRVVEVYREHRIMTDGQRFGVEWPQGIDLRYESTKEARAEIDSELGSAGYKRAREESLWLVAPDDSPIACACCGGRGESKKRSKLRRDEPDCTPEPDAVIAFERRDGRFVRVGAVRSIAARAYEICEEPAGDEEHRRVLERVAASLRAQEPIRSRPT